MKISTKGRYGLRALVDLVLHQDGKPILLKDIAKRQKISRRYLERLFSHLKVAGILGSVRGASGGYLLMGDPEKITIYDILVALEGSMTPVDCAKNKKLCVKSGSCMAQVIWTDLTEKITSVLKERTLAEAAKMQAEMDANSGDMYII